MLTVCTEKDTVPFSVGVEMEICPFNGVFVAENIKFIEAEGMLRGISSRIGYSTVDTHETFFENRMETLSCYEGLIRTVIFLFLLFIPIIWIYAQILFFKKRENAADGLIRL